MAGTVTQSNTHRGNIGVITLTCTADAADGSFPATALTTKISGRILALETNPGATAPTANYDITLVDAESYDVLQSLGLNRHTSNTERVSIVYSGTAVSPESAITDTWTWTIANNSVNSAIVVAKLYYEGYTE